MSDVEVGRPGFLMHLTKPGEIKQLVVEGTEIMFMFMFMFMFTGADEEQLRSLAHGIT